MNLQDNPFYREAFSEGQQRGKAEGEQCGRERLLRKQLQLKFGPLPPWAEAKLAAADSDTLELWAEWAARQQAQARAETYPT